MMAVQIRRATPKDVQFGRRLIDIETAMGLDTVEHLWAELQGYVDVLLGRVPSPIDSPYLSMMEVAVAYYARAQEMDMRIHAAEREGIVAKGSALFKFRTGELSAFIELARKCADLGSRRLTQETLLADARRADSI
jgi:hypothetical protein